MMAEDVFSWTIDLYGTTNKVKRSVQIVKFGDGYEQRSVEGISPALKEWSVTKTAQKEEADAIERFLLSHVVKPFLWTPCDYGQGKYVLGEGEINRNAIGAGWYQLTWTMREVRA